MTRPATNGALLFLDDGDGLEPNPGGLFLVFAGTGTAKLTVTDATADKLKVEHMGTPEAILYDIVIVGKS